ncbi:hypothetical protein J0X19_23115 [Hymenobacter sp. BT186]|uniref:Uncharacterized protein n=1 Tax=Hymenobacter telluris TaxID=2816474 RepID=A0A939EZS4_9BACT|nr:hypothetical protein [Hymenobacter telluris]MBO0360869.1 hypothetical protein [Hymenobacter telluris]MBW3376898.1 hypothetical protein [Hymenobacter norwichensis]
MDFINPVEVLSLGTGNNAAIDTSALKKAKRRVQAEIELSDDGHLDYRGRKITLSDCEPFFKEIEQNNLFTFYCFLAETQDLNDFLATGSPRIFSSFRQESIYKDTDFVSFISPYFAAQYDKALLRAFADKNAEEVAAVASLTPLVSLSYLDACYKSVFFQLKNHTTQLEEATMKLKADVYAPASAPIAALLANSQAEFSPVLVNKLPGYFQNSLNTLAQALRNLGVHLFNKGDETTTSLQYLELAVAVRADEVVHEDIDKVYKQITAIRDKRVEQEKYRPLIERFNNVRKSLNDINTKLNTNAGSTTELLARLDSLFSIEELNALPESLIDVRDQIAITLRNLSISAWNNDNDILWSAKLINQALTIHVSSDMRATLQKEKGEIAALEVKYKDILSCWFCEDSMLDKDATYKKEVYKVTHRSYSGRTRKVSYAIKELSFPRCKHCKRTHFKGTMRYWLSFIGSGLLALVIGVGLAQLIWGGSSDVEGAVWGAFALAVVAGHLIGRLMEKKLLASLGVKSKYTKTLSTHSMMESLRKDEWSWSKPAA